MWDFPKRVAVILHCAWLMAHGVTPLAGADDNYGDATAITDECCLECCDGSWSIGAEFLSWKASIDGLPISQITTDRSVVSSVALGAQTVDVVHWQRHHAKICYPSYPWRAGVRLNVDYSHPDSFLDFDGRWTYLYSHAHGAQSITPSNLATETQTLQNAWPTGLKSPLPAYDPTKQFLKNRIEGHWSLNYNTLELSIGRPYPTCHGLTLRPHLDLKIAWIQQRFHNAFISQGAIAVPNTAPLTLSLYESVAARQHFIGVGPQLGFQAAWQLSYSWNIYAKAASAILYGWPRVKWRSHSAIENASIPTLDFDNAHNRQKYGYKHPLVYNTSLGVGIGWNTWICNNSYFLGLKLGWEHHLYFAQNYFQRSISFETDRGTSDLSLYGLTAGANLAF